MFVSAENNPELSPIQVNQVNDSLRRITDIATIDNKIAKSSEMSEPLSKTINDLLAEFFPNVNLEKK